MYVFGGRDQDNTKLNDTWKLNLETLEWKEIITDYMLRPVERSGHSCDVIGQYMLVFGGFYDITKELNDMYLFDFENESWIQIF